MQRYNNCVFLLQNAFFSMYLLNNFSTVVDTAVKFSEIVGYTHRYIPHFLSVYCLLMQEDAYKVICTYAAQATGQPCAFTAFVISNAFKMLCNKP